LDSELNTPNSELESKEETRMPIVQISMVAGRTPEKKEQLIKKVTDAIIDVLQIPADRVQIILNEIPKENIGHGGVPLSKID
jgi:4-oxalocrotonate tautomerase